MNYPERFQQFVEFSKVLSSMLEHIDSSIPEYDELLAEKSDKLRPHLAKSYTYIAEYYSVPLSELYKDILEEASTVKPPDNAI
ncbi:MAG: hypothetical protein GQ527_05405, partial [Bacteroidales bacterium]|nr:hypothetical protein [Bacteroidales bacterium]